MFSIRINALKGKDIYKIQCLYFIFLNVHLIVVYANCEWFSIFSNGRCKSINLYALTNDMHIKYFSISIIDAIHISSIWQSKFTSSDAKRLHIFQITKQLWTVSNSFWIALCIFERIKKKSIQVVGFCLCRSFRSRIKAIIVRTSCQFPFCLAAISVLVCLATPPTSTTTASNTPSTVSSYMSKLH